MDQSGDIVY